MRTEMHINVQFFLPCVTLARLMLEYNFKKLILYLINMWIHLNINVFSNGNTSYKVVEEQFKHVWNAGSLSDRLSDCVCGLTDWNRISKHVKITTRLTMSFTFLTTGVRYYSVFVQQKTRPKPHERNHGTET